MADNVLGTALGILAMGKPSGGGGGTPSEYLKRVNINGNNLEFVKKDDTTQAYNPSIPTKTSDLTNDSGFLTEHQSLADYRKSADQDVIDNAAKARLDTIEGEIDSAASSSNKLLPESKIDSKIAASIARKLYKDASQHQFASHAELKAATTFYNAAGQAVTVNENDAAIVLDDEDQSHKKTLYVAASINPVVWGLYMDWSDNEIVLNGTSRIGETVTIYAPEASGNAGNVLFSKGANQSPEWKSILGTDITHFEHNILCRSTYGDWVSFKFTNTAATPYSTVQYGTSEAAQKAISKAIYDLGFVGMNNQLLANGPKSTTATRESIYGAENSNFYIYDGSSSLNSWVQVLYTEVYDTVVPVKSNLITPANYTYYKHDVKMAWANGQFITLSFVDRNIKAYNVTNYGTVANAYNAVRGSLYALGYNSANNPCLCASNAGGTIFVSAIASETVISTWTGNAWQTISGVVAITDTAVPVSGAEGYTGGTGIEVSADRKISAAQHQKIYNVVIAAGETSKDLAVDENYNVTSYIATDNTGDVVLVEAKKTTTGYTFAIKEALANNINILVTALNTPEATIVLGCPFPVGSVYTSVGTANPSTIWANTTWSQLADGQFLMNTTDDTLVNSEVAEQLPNIKSDMIEFVIGSNTAANGAFKTIWNTGGACSYHGGGEWKNGRFTFDASACNAAYTDNGKVRPKSLACKMWIRTA